MEDIKDLATVDDSYEQIKQVGITYQKKTVESVLAFSRIVYVLQQKCNKEKTNEFNSKALEYWGLSNSGASQFAKTGEHADRLIGYSQNLPPSSRALYELTQLPLKKLDEHINVGDINPNSTVNDIKAIKDTLKEEKKAKKKVSSSEDNPFDIDVEDEDGNKVEAELVTNKEEQKEEPPKKKGKMTVMEALSIFGIDMNLVYMEAVQKQEVDTDLLNKAFYVITGEAL